MALLDCNIVITNSPNFQGQCVNFAETFTGRAMIFNAANTTLTFNANNLTRVDTVGTSVSTSVAINNVDYPTPFSGTNKSLEMDGLKRKVRKNFVFRANIMTNTYGGLDAMLRQGKNWIICAEKKVRYNATDIYHKYEIFGALNPMQIADDGLSWDPYSAVGATITLTTLEDYITVYYGNTSQKSFFDAWWSTSF